MSSTGDLVVAWASYLQDGSGWGIYSQLFGSGGGGPGPDADGVADDVDFDVNAGRTLCDTDFARASNDPWCEIGVKLIDID